MEPRLKVSLRRIRDSVTLIVHFSNISNNRPDIPCFAVTNFHVHSSRTTVLSKHIVQMFKAVTTVECLRMQLYSESVFSAVEMCHEGLQDDSSQMHMQLMRCAYPCCCRARTSPPVNVVASSSEPVSTLKLVCRHSV